jgi:hypothetical protein
MPDDAPEDFLIGVARLREARLRPEIVLDEIPAPQRIAPYAAAWSAEIVLNDEELATGRFVLLYDPAGQEPWEGTFRAVTLAQASLEPDVGADPLLGQIGWTWLQECLDTEQADRRAEGGTVTRIMSESYGTLEDRPPNIEVELRASWTPLNDLSRHVMAWGALLSTIAGLPPLPDGVTALTRRR